MELDELPLCLSDISNELREIYTHMRMAWRQAAVGQIDLFYFLSTMSQVHVNLSELLELYFSHEKSNFNLYFHYTYFEYAWREMMNVVCVTNTVWHEHHEFLFKGIAMKAISLAGLFSKEAREIAKLIERDEQKRE